MADLVAPNSAAADLYDQGLPRPVPFGGKCERCQDANATIAGRFCQRCYDLIEARLHVERESRKYLNDFCARAKDAARQEAGRERLAPPKNPLRTMDAEARPVVEIRALPAAD